MIHPNTEDARILMTEGCIALTKASLVGIHVDVAYCKKQEKVLSMKIKNLLKDFENTKPGRIWAKMFQNPNYNSDAQLRVVLFDKMKIKALSRTEPSATYPEGQAKVDNETLEIISKEYPELAGYSKFKKYDKLKNTYISGILKEQVNGILHPFFPLNTTQTFRGSSTNINFQNQPNRDPEQKQIIRKAFIPRKKHGLLTADFGGIEVAISCCNHKDPKMIKYVKDERTDMHRDLAIDCYKLDEYQKEGAEKTLRKGAKNGFVFPQFYGDYYKNNAPALLAWANLPTSAPWSRNDGLKLMTGITIGEHLINKGIKNYEDFEEHIHNVQDHFWLRRFKTYNQWKINNVESYYKKGYLHTLTGFTCSGIMSKNQINNYPIQGPAFHCTLRTFIEITKRIEKYKLETRLIGQIHDELVFDCYLPETDTILEMIREVACIWLPKQWPWIIVPLRIEANKFNQDADWASASDTVKLTA